MKVRLSSWLLFSAAATLFVFSSLLASGALAYPYTYDDEDDPRNGVEIWGERIPFSESAEFYQMVFMQWTTWQEVQIMTAFQSQMQLNLEELAANAAFTACNKNGKVTPATRAMTSHEPEITLRQVAATNIVDAAMGPRSPAANNSEIVVMYSDGGFETVLYCTTCSVHTLVPNTLREGSGTPESACATQS